jgi:hypothetical protein
MHHSKRRTGSKKSMCECGQIPANDLACLLDFIIPADMVSMKQVYERDHWIRLYGLYQKDVMRFTATDLRLVLWRRQLGIRK